jgi:hypothetical protein
LTSEPVEDILILNMFIYESVIEIRAPRAEVWPLLCGATMRLPPPLLFRLGVPQPVECRLGTDGETRECVTRRGRVRQRILERRAPEVLSFERTGDTAGLRRWIRSMKDTFRLEEIDGGTRLRRRSELEPRIWAVPFLWIALPAIHRYVNRNFKAIAEQRPEPIPEGRDGDDLKSVLVGDRPRTRVPQL